MCVPEHVNILNQLVTVMESDFLQKPFQNIDMFRNAHSDFIYEIISLLEFQVYLPGEYITYAGNYASLFKNWTVA